MSKYDTMISLNKKNNEEKVALAQKIIRKMLDDKEKITIPKLMAKTGLSRGFFYNNPVVREEVGQAQKLQGGMADPRKNILDMAMNAEIEQLAAMMRENENLKIENEKYKRAIKSRNESVLRRL